MQYTVITKTGKIKQFYINEVAEMYKSNFGGCCFYATNSIPKYHKNFGCTIIPKIV